MTRKKKSKRRSRSRSEPEPVATETGAEIRRSRSTVLWLVLVVAVAVVGLALWYGLGSGGAPEGTPTAANGAGVLSDREVIDDGDVTDDREEKALVAESVPSPGTIATLDPDLEAAIKAAVARAESEPETLGALGRLYHAHEFYELATTCYERAAARDPQEAAWPYYLGVLAERRGDHAVAVDQFQRVLELEPDDLAARVRLGEVLLAASRLEESASVFEEVSRLHPEAAWGPRGLGLVAEQRGQLEVAAAALERAIEPEPTDGRANYLAGLLAQRLGRQQQAAAALSRFRASPEARVPADPRMDALRSMLVGVQQRMRLAAAQLEAGELEAAKRTYGEVLERDASNFGALVNLANVNGRLGDQAEAEVLLRRAIQIEPQNPHGHFGLAMAYASRSDFARARDELDTVLRLDPNHAGARALLERLPPD